MNRYSNTRIKRKENGDRVYSYITPTYGVRLDILANEYYGDSSLWWIIAQANSIKGFTALYTKNFKGELRIPTQIQDILSEFKAMNE